MNTARLMTAMITPFQENLEVNYDKAAELAEYLIQQGNDGLVVCGTTGESPTLTPEEKLKLFSTVVSRVGAGTQVWAGVGSYHTEATVELAKEAEKTGVYGIMLVTPYYNKPSQEGLYQHFRRIAEASSLPVMLYNIPSRTACNLLPETVARLAQIDNVTAIKEASGSMNQLSDLKSLLPPSMLVYSGDDSLTLPMMSLGAAGVISVVSHLAGKRIKEMIENFEKGELLQARQIHNELYPLFRGLFMATNPVPVKEALNMTGWGMGGFRLPMIGLSETERKALRELLMKYGMVS